MKNLILVGIYLLLGFTGCTALKEDLKTFSYGDSKRLVLINYCILNPNECRAVADMNITTKPRKMVECEIRENNTTLFLECPK